MKRYTILAEDGFPMSYEEGVEKTEIVQDTEGDWVKWDDVQANTIPIPDVRVEDEGSYDPRNRWSVYLNRRCMGIHTEKESADAQAEYIRFALNIPQ